MALETISDLIKAFREDERDAVAPYLWSDGQLVRFANQALVEFAERTMSIRDAGVELFFPAEQDEAPYPDFIIDIVSAEQNGRCLDVDLTERPRGWRYGSQRAGLSVNRASGLVFLRPKPMQDEVVRLLVVRRPLREAGLADRVPDVPASDRHILLSHIKRLAYLVQDAELYDPSKASAYGAEFERQCQAACERGILRRGDCSRPIRARW